MRPSREQILVDTAYLWAKRSTCDRLHVGAIIHRQGRIISVGYNGAPAGLPHCDHPHETEDCLAVHAEQNAISYAARNGVALGGASLVVTHQPCRSCAMSIINSGIRHVTYVEPYRLVEGLSLLLDAGIEVAQHVDAETTAMIGFESD